MSVNNTTHEPEHGPLAGFTVGVTAARRADELGTLLTRRGAAVLHAPALRIVPLADDSELLTLTEQLIDHAPDVVIATTAIGFRGWVEAADGWGLGEALLSRLQGVELLARGPKVKGAIRAAGLTEEWSPTSESMAEVLDRLLAEGVQGRRIAIQLHGEPLPGFVEALRAGGADVVGVPVYRWMPPEDITPLDRLIDATVGRGVDALAFTSAPAAASLLSRAEERGMLPGLLAALGHDVLSACVGPVTALPLQAHGIDTAQPERFRLGPLVQLICRELPNRARTLPVAGRSVEIRGHACRGRRRAAPRAARGHVPAAGAGPPSGLGRLPGGPPPGTAGLRPRRTRRRNGDGPPARLPRRAQPHPDGGQARLPPGAGPGGGHEVRGRVTPAAPGDARTPASPTTVAGGGVPGRSPQGVERSHPEEVPVPERSAPEETPRRGTDPEAPRTHRPQKPPASPATMAEGDAPARHRPQSPRTARGAGLPGRRTGPTGAEWSKRRTPRQRRPVPFCRRGDHGEPP